MLRNFAAVIGGVLGGIFLVGLITQASHKIYGSTEDINMEDTEAFQEFIASLPLEAFLFIILANAMGALMAALIASKLAESNRFYLGLVAGLFIFLGALIMEVSIPGPGWLLPVDLLSTAMMTLIGAKLGSR